MDHPTNQPLNSSSPSFDGDGPQGKRKQVNGKLIDHVLQILRNEYIVVGKTRVRAWHAWLLIGIAAGIAAGIILVANQSGEVELSSASIANSQVPFCDGNWKADILDDPQKMVTNNEWEPSIAVSDQGDIAIIEIAGGLWVKPAGGAWQNEIPIAGCDFDSACVQNKKKCGGDPAIGWDGNSRRFVVAAKCADDPSALDVRKELGIGTVVPSEGQWQWTGWKKAADIGYDFANLAIGLNSTYWLSGIANTVKITSGQESKVFYSDDVTLSRQKSWRLGPYVPGFVVGMAPLTDTDTAGVSLDGIGLHDLISQSPPQPSLHFFRMTAGSGGARMKLVALKKDIAKTILPSPSSFLGGLADCTSGTCQGKQIKNTHIGFYRHPLVAYEKNGEWVYRSLLPSSDIRDDEMVWAAVLKEVVSLNSGKDWSVRTIAGGLRGDSANPNNWKDAHLGGIAFDASTGLVHLFYHYRDGADKTQESLYYRTLDTRALNAAWSGECVLPYAKDITPGKGPGTGRDYADISVQAGRVAIVFQAAPARCQASQKGCPVSVLGVLKNF